MPRALCAVCIAVPASATEGPHWRWQEQEKSNDNKVLGRTARHVGRKAPLGCAVPLIAQDSTPADTILCLAIDGITYNSNKHALEPKCAYACLLIANCCSCQTCALPIGPSDAGHNSMQPQCTALTRMQACVSPT